MSFQCQESVAVFQDNANMKAKISGAITFLVSVSNSPAQTVLFWFN